MKYTKNIIPVAFLAISITSFTSCDKISGKSDGETSTEYSTEAEYANTESKEDATESLSKAKETEDKLSSQSDSINGHN